MLHAAENVYWQPKGQADNKVDAQADSCYKRAEQPEALAETLSFRRCYAARRPEWSQQVLEREEQQRCGNIEPAGKEGRSNQGTQAAQRVKNDALYHATPVSDFIKHGRPVY